MTILDGRTRERETYREVDLPPVIFRHPRRGAGVGVRANSLGWFLGGGVS